MINIPDGRHHLSRMTARPLLLVLVIILPSCFPDFLKDDKTEVATILERAIYDQSGGASRILMKTDDETTTFYSDTMEHLIRARDGRVSIDDSLDEEIVARYPRRVYVVRVRLCIEKTTKQFVVDRKEFNLLRVGVITKFVMNQDETAIDSLIAY